MPVSFGLLVGVLPGLLRGAFEGLFLDACCACLPFVKVLKYRAMNTTAVPTLQGARTEHAYLQTKGSSRAF